MTRYYPVIATVLIELASVGHIVQMFQARSSAGQNPLSYLLLMGALVLWERYYSLETPDQRPAIWTARASLVVNALVLAAVLYFRP